MFGHPEDSAITQSLRETMAGVLAWLAPPQAAALMPRFGLDGGPERSWREIGSTLGTSGHTAKRLVERAQNALRRVYQ